MRDGRSSFVGHAWTVTLFTLISRVAGLLRDAVLSAVFGTTGIASSFVTALIVPNVFRRLFGEGALSAAFLPQYTRLCDADRAEAGRFASLVMALLLGTLGALVVLAEVVMFALLGAQEHGGVEARSDVLTLTMIMLPYMPLVCATAIAGGMLQARGKFVPHAAAPILLNLCMIGAAIAFAYGFDASMRATAVAVALSVLIAGVLQLLWCVWSMRRDAHWTTRFAGAWPLARETLRRMGPAAIGLGALQLSTLLDALIAGWPVIVGPTIAGHPFPMDQSSASTLYYAQRLYQFPLGVFGIAIATAIFPLLSRRAGEPGEFAAVLRRGMRLSLFIGVPAAIGLILVRDDLTAAVYLRGKFEPGDVPRVGNALACFAPAVWAYALTHVLTRAYYAKGDTRTPMRIGIATVAGNAALNLTLMWSMREAGLALATAITAMAQSMLLLWLASKKFSSPHEPLIDRETAAGFAMTLLCAGAMAAAIWMVRSLAGPVGDNTWSGHALTLARDVTIGLVVYAALSARRTEMRMLLGG